MELSNIITEWKTKYFPKFLSQHFKTPNFDMGECAQNNCRAILSNDEMESIE